jgi:hypothetical protein
MCEIRFVKAHQNSEHHLWPARGSENTELAKEQETDHGDSHMSLA